MTKGYNRRETPEKITSLKKNEIFVFGSNLAGQHGGGAARFAYEKFGAVWGEGVGLHGQTYAIPTMHGGVDAIKPYVDDFIQFAKGHSDLTFLVTPIGCGIAGFTAEEMAPLFAMAINVPTIILPKSFVAVISRHEYVDLGLPSGLKWATCNVGALYPEDYGDHYMWGYTERYNPQASKLYKWKSQGLPKAFSGCPEYDVASAKWGDNWRIPMASEFNELREFCQWEWTSLGEDQGFYTVTGKNGNSIILPAAGRCIRDNLDVREPEVNGAYWASTRDSYLPDCLKISAGLRYLWSQGATPEISPEEGLSIRPVKD